ncbi:MAG TPA: extracellular solute-binding protein [Chloroflexota bacterium]|nr:extracellular solute-binding protein [Chloroflexota bacterium]
MRKPHDSPAAPPVSSDPSPAAPSLTRRSLLQGAATTAGALLAAPAAGALATAPVRAIAAPAFTPPPEGTLTIWDRAGDLFHVFDAVIPAFNKKYPRIKVNHLTIDVDAKLPSTLATGVAVPDGSFYEDNNLPGQRAHFYDITNWIEPYVKDLVPFKVTVNSQGGRIYGVPWDLDPGLLYYREDLLQKAGVDPMSIATYDDLLTAAHTLQRKLGAKVKPIHLEQDPGLTLLWTEMFANQQGMSMVNAQGKLTINSAPYLKIMQWYKQVHDEGLGTHAVYTSPDDLTALDNGQVALYPWAIWFSYAPQFQLKKTKGLWRAMPLPAWTAGGARGAVMGGSSFIIPKQAKNPYLAWLWYEFLNFNPQGYQAVYGPNKLYPGGLNTSLPSYKPALAHQLFKNVPALGGQDLWQVAVGTVKSIPGTYYYPAWYNQASSYFGTNIQRMFAGQMSPQQVLAQSASQIQTNLVNRA